MTQIIAASLQGDVLSDREDVRVVGLVHPFKGERIDVNLPSGLSIQELLDRALDGHERSRLAPDFLVQIDGYPVPREWFSCVRVKPGVTVTFRPALHGSNILKTILTFAVVVAAILIAGPLGGGAALAGALGVSAATGFALVSAGVVFAGTLALNALFPTRPPAATTTEAFAQLNSIAGAQNQANQFGPIPVVLGVHRQSPFYAAKPYTEIVGDDQYLCLLFCWGYGPLSISAQQIGETTIGAFSVEVETRQGFPGDAPITLYPSRVDEQALSVTLVALGGSGEPLDDSQINWETRTTPPEADVISVDLTAPDGMFKVDSNGNPGGWSVVIRGQYRAVGSGGAWSLLGAVTFYRSVKTARMGMRQQVARGQYDVRVGKAQRSFNDQTVHEKVVWTALRSSTNEPPVAFGKPLALTALRIRATDQLNGVVDTFNGITGSLVTAYSGVPGVWIPNALSQWPSDLFRWALQSPANARPRGDSEIDLANLEAWWVYCVANGFKFNQIRTSVTSVYSCLADIAAAGRAVPTFIDGKWGVVWDRPNDSIVQHFTPRNSWGFAGAKPYVHLPHALRVGFINEQIGYAQDERVVYDDGYNVTNATLFEQQQFPGVTDPGLIHKHGRFHIAQSRLRPEEITLNAGWENLVCTRGDRVRVTHDALLIGQVSGRVKGVAGQVVTLDELVTMEFGKTYGIRFRLEDGTSLYRSVDLNVGEQTDVTLSASGGVPGVGDLFAFGESEQESAVYRVKTIAHQVDLVAQLTLVDDAPAISQADQGPIPPYTSNVTIPPDPLTLPPRSLGYSEVIDGFGESARLLVRLVWQVPRFGKIQAFQVQAKDNNAGGDWQTVVTVPAPTLTADVPIIGSLVTTASWGFRVRCLFESSPPSGWAELDPLFLKGLLAPLEAVPSLTAVFKSNVMELSWTEITDFRPGIIYEIRKGADWNSGSALGRFAHPPVPTLGDGVYQIKGLYQPAPGYAVYSTDATGLSITGSVLPLNAKATWDESATGWSGTTSGFVLFDGTFIRTSATGDILSVPDVLALSDVLNYGGQGQGFYEIPTSHQVDVGYVAPCLVAITFSSSGVAVSSNFFAYNPLFDVADFFGADANTLVDVHPQIALSQDGVTFGEWQNYQAGTYNARKFKARMVVNSNDPQTIAFLTSFVFTVYVPTRVDNWGLIGGVRISLTNLLLLATGNAIVFLPDNSAHAAPFNGGVSNPTQPSFSVTILNAQPGDLVSITNLTLAGCTVQVLNAGIGVARRVNIRPEGY